LTHGFGERSDTSQVQQQDWFIVGDPGSDGLLIHSALWKLFSFAHRNAKQVLGQAPKLRLGGPQVEKIIGTGDIANSSVANVREAEDPSPRPRGRGAD